MLEMQKADIYICLEKRSKNDLQSICGINGCGRIVVCVCVSAWDDRDPACHDH